MLADASPRKLRLWTALIVVAIFLGGVATGAGAGHLFRPGGPFGPPGHRPPPVPPPGAPLPRELRELDLTPDQERAARDLIERHRPEMEAILRDTFPRFESIRRQIESELRPHLTEAQARKLDAHRENPLPGPPRPPGEPAPR